MIAIVLETVPYQQAALLQERLVDARLAGEIGDVLLLLEHPPTITLGRAAHREHLIASPDELDAMDVAVVETDRGGDITFHGPGQIVGYPIVDLSRRRRDIHWYLRSLEEAIIGVCAEFGLAAERRPPHTGVWVQHRKLASIGIKVRRWVTSHGFALNLADVSRWFRLIVPCGIHGCEVTWLARELHCPPPREVLCRALSHAVGRSLRTGGVAEVPADNESVARTVRIVAEALDMAPMSVLEC